MTIVATCPKGHELTLEERLAGKKIRCPRCKSVFQVPELNGADDDDDDDDDEAVSEKPLRRRPARRDDDDEDDDDRPRKARKAAAHDDDDDDDDEPEEESQEDYEERKRQERREKRKQLKLVNVGLLLHAIKLWIYVVGGIITGMAVLIMIVIAVAQAAGLAEGAEGPEVGGGVVVFGIGLFALLIIMLNGIISMISPLLGIAGSFLLCFVPKKSRARGTVVMSLTFDLVALLCFILTILAGFGAFGFEIDKVMRLQNLLRYLSVFCQIAAWLTFLTFLRGLGAYLGEPGVGNEALNLIARLVVQVITTIGNVVANFLSAMFLGGIHPYLGIGAAIFFILAWIGQFIYTFFIRLLKLIGALRRAVKLKV